MDDDERAEEIVSRLRAISSDEKSELGKLRCRIDDQARLIMMLKKRNDEYILANLHLEQQINDRQTQLDLFNEQCHEEQLKDQQLKQLRQTIEQLTNAADQSRLNEQQSQLLLQRSHDQLTEAQQRLDALELTLQLVLFLRVSSTTSISPLQTDQRNVVFSAEPIDGIAGQTR